MKKERLLKIIDFTLLSMWCISLTLGAFYPEQLERYTLFVIACFFIDAIIVQKTKLYKPWKENINLWIIRLLLLLFPFIIIFILALTGNFEGGFGYRGFFLFQLFNR